MDVNQKPKRQITVRADQSTPSRSLEDELEDYENLKTEPEIMKEELNPLAAKQEEEEKVRRIEEEFEAKIQEEIEK